MSVKVVSLPVAWAISREAAQALTDSGRMELVKNQHTKEASEAEAELNEALGNGYTVIASHVVDVSHRTLIVFTLYKADGE